MTVARLTCMALALCMLTACMRPAAERAHRDLEVGIGE